MATPTCVAWQGVTTLKSVLAPSAPECYKLMEPLVQWFPPLWSRVRTDLLHGIMRTHPDKCRLLLTMAVIIAPALQELPGV